MAWNFDTSKAPKGGFTGGKVLKGPKGKERLVPVYEAPRVILATKCGKVLTSRWLPASEAEKRPEGRWEFLGVKESPIAWQLYPTHPDGDSK